MQHLLIRSTCGHKLLNKVLNDKCLLFVIWRVCEYWLLFNFEFPILKSKWWLKQTLTSLMNLRLVKKKCWCIYQTRHSMKKKHWRKKKVLYCYMQKISTTSQEKLNTWFGAARWQGKFLNIWLTNQDFTGLFHVFGIANIIKH